MIRQLTIASILGVITLLSSCNGQPAMATNDNCLLDADVCGALTGLDEENYNFIGNGFNIQDIAANGSDVTADSEGIAAIVYSQVGVFTQDNFERVAFTYGDSFLEFDVDDANSFVLDWNINNLPQVTLDDTIIRVGVSQVDRPREVSENYSILIGLGAIVVGMGLRSKHD